MSTRTGRALEADVQRAYEIQAKAAITGGARSTGIGIGLAVIGHYTWPFFRRQTLAFKGFLVCGFTMFGMVMGADTALIAHQAQVRARESKIRKEARIDLARRGLVPTETEIANWRAEREREREREIQSTPPPNTAPDS